MKDIRVIGAGPGAAEYLTPAAVTEAGKCDLLLGSKRALELFSQLNIDMIDCSGMLNSYQQIIEEEGKKKAIGVVVTGDPGFHSLLAFLRKKFSKERLKVTPGISSVQYLFTRLTTPWQDYRLLSFHGRQIDNLEDILAETKGVALLTDKKMSPDKICSLLVDTPYRDYRAIVGERLSYSDEEITVSTVAEISEMDAFKMAVLVIDDEG